MKVNLDLVLIHQAGLTPVSVRCLSEQESADLVDHYVNGRNTPEVVRCLELAWRQRQWLACHCRAPGQRPPLFFVRQPQRNVFVLVSMPDRPPHSPDCPFGREPADRAAAPPTPAIPELAHLLFRWITGARLNLLYPYDCEDLVHTQYVALRETAKGLHIAPGRKLFDYSRSHPDGLGELLRRLSAHRGDGERPVWGAYLAVVSSLRLAALNDAFGEYAREVGINIASLTRLPTTVDDGPHIVLCALTPDPARNNICAERVLAHPVYSRRQLIPVDAGYERHTLTLLLEVQQRLLMSQQLIMTIRKTLPETTVHERGIAFQVSVLGPNGQPLRQLDVVSVNTTDLTGEATTLESWQRVVLDRGSAGEVLYHAASAESSIPASDALFTAELGRRLLAPVPPRVSRRRVDISHRAEQPLT